MPKTRSKAASTVEQLAHQRAVALLEDVQGGDHPGKSTAFSGKSGTWVTRPI